MRLEELARLFAGYRIYPASCYRADSPARVFQRMFPAEHYSRDIEILLRLQDYAPRQRGADLPFWGKKYFTEEKGLRVMIVSQDSLMKDAGSVVLYAHLMPVIQDKVEFRTYDDQVHAARPGGRSFYASWRIVRDQLRAWNIDLDFLYLTDAKKVYTEGSWEDRDFDDVRSRELLKAEIELCDPDLLILLGRSPLAAVDEHLSYADILERKTIISVCGKTCIVAPFFFGMGRTQSGFREKMRTATELISQITLK